MIDRQTLVNSLSESGYHVSDRQLQLWATRGLIPKPDIHRMGKGRGTRALYPDGILEQVAAICQLLQRENNLEAVRLALWRSGHPVNIQPLLTQSIAHVRFLLNEINKDDVFSEAVIDTIEYSEDVKSSKPLISRVYRRMKRKGDLIAFVRLLSGVYTELDASHVKEDNELDTRVFSQGMSAFLPNRNPSKRQLPDKQVRQLVNELRSDFRLKTDVYQFLDEIRCHARPDHLEELVSTASDSDLRKADRRVLRIIDLLNWLNDFSRLFSGQKDKRPLIKKRHLTPMLQGYSLMMLYSIMRDQSFETGLEKLMQHMDDAGI